MSRIIFHLDLDTFFVAVERLLNPMLVGKPVIVSPGTARSVVAAASYEARKFGVHSAQPLAQARRLCPQAVICPGNFRAYQRYSRAFFAILESYSPDIEPASLDEGYMDYTACVRLSGPPMITATRIQQQVRERLGLDVSIGISAAKVVAKIASDLAKPAGILQVLPGYEATLLAPLAIRRLPGVGSKIEPRLLALGVRTIGDLARISRPRMVKVLGEYGLALQEAAQGKGDSIVEKREQVRSVSNEETFSVDTTDPAFLRCVLHRLVCKVGYRLRQKGLRARSACVKVRYADFSLHTRSLTLPEATDLDCRLFVAAVKLLDQVRLRGKRIRLLGFAGRKLVVGDKTQEKLLHLEDSLRQEQLHQAADRIRRRYRYDTVHWASLLQS